jgi:hypothetical protein
MKFRFLVGLMTVYIKHEKDIRLFVLERATAHAISCDLIKLSRMPLEELIKVTDIQTPRVIKTAEITTNDIDDAFLRNTTENNEARTTESTSSPDGDTLHASRNATIKKPKYLSRFRIVSFNSLELETTFKEWRSPSFLNSFRLTSIGLMVNTLSHVYFDSLTYCDPNLGVMSPSLCLDTSLNSPVLQVRLWVLGTICVVFSIAAYMKLGRRVLLTVSISSLISQSLANA